MMKRRDKSNIENNENMNIILEGTKFIGDIIASSSVRINGQLVGNIIAQSKVEIGRTGIVYGNINCDAADIEGILEGKIEVNNLLILRENSKVVGDILSSKLHIEEGAIFLGECRMSGHQADMNKAPQLTSSVEVTQE